MKPILILTCFVLYTILIFIISRITSRKSNNETYFRGNRASPWYVVSYGMIGASLSGVTFMSVPGLVGDEGFSYMVLVLGYVLGYIVIAFILLPLYYKLNLTSIYTYLNNRFGINSYKTGSSYFILSRLIGSSFRMFLVVHVLQLFVFDNWGIPFWTTVGVFIILILLYTYKGGIRTIVWTDTLQTTFMLAAVIITIVLISKDMGKDIPELIGSIKAEGYTKMFVFDIKDPRFFLKQFFAGMFITITMTGLDQDMMQKNLSCRKLSDAQKNMISFGGILIFVNLIFLFLGGLLYKYAMDTGLSIPSNTDDLFPLIAIQYLGIAAGITFLFGLISAAYSSADGTLTALTTAFCIDFLGLRRKPNIDEQKTKKIRYLVHSLFALLMFIIIVGYRLINDEALISQLFTIAGYTYGPLLGLFTFGIYTKRNVKDGFVPLVCILSPLICYVLSVYSEQLFWGYQFGFEILLLNGMLTFTGLIIIQKPKNK